MSFASSDLCIDLGKRKTKSKEGSRRLLCLTPGGIITKCGVFDYRSLYSISEVKRYYLRKFWLKRKKIKFMHGSSIVCFVHYFTEVSVPNVTMLTIFKAV